MKAVSVVFGQLRHGNKEYTYKTDIDFEVGDIAIVKRGQDYKFVTVATVDAPLDPNASFEYAWIVQKLDTTDFDNRLQDISEQGVFKL